MSKFYYVYVLQSERDHNLYVGYTSDIKKRLEEHNNGKVPATSNRGSLKLIYWEGCLNRQDAMEKEKYLKTSWGKKYIKNRLQEYFALRPL